MKLAKVLMVLTFLAGGFSYAEGPGSNPCKEDKAKLCGDCKQSEKGCVKKCMKKNKDKLSPACLEHRASKKKK